MIDFPDFDSPDFDGPDFDCPDYYFPDFDCPWYSEDVFRDFAFLVFSCFVDNSDDVVEETV